MGVSRLDRAGLPRPIPEPYYHSRLCHSMDKWRQGSLQPHHWLRRGELHRVGLVCFAADQVWLVLQLIRCDLFCCWSGAVCFAYVQVWSVLQLIRCDLYSSWSGVICFAVDRVWFVLTRCEYEQATGECHNRLQKKCSADTGTEGSRLPITWTVLANQNVTNNSLWEKPQEWPLRWANKLKRSNRAKTMVDSEQNFQNN